MQSGASPEAPVNQKEGHQSTCAWCDPLEMITGDKVGEEGSGSLGSHGGRGRVYLPTDMEVFQHVYTR